MNVRNMARCALFAALLTICAWIAVPIGDIAVTMQTLGIFLTLGLLGGKRGTLAIFLYLLLGLVGLPVFTGFQGGAGVLLGTTGGYLTGFLFSGLVYWLVTACRGPKPLAMVLGLVACYAFGTLWFRFGYLQGGSTMGIGAVLLKCVAPYLLPDGIKLALALSLTTRLRRRLNRL